jgi:hypothetical protein
VYRYSLGDPLMDSYLAFVGGEACAEPGSTTTGDLAMSCLSTTEPFADTTIWTG